MGLMKVVDNFVLCGGFNGEELNKISCGGGYWFYKRELGKKEERCNKKMREV